MTTRWSFAFFMSYDEIRFIRNFLGAKCPVGWVFSPFYLILNRTDISVPVQFNSHAKHCYRSRKALQSSTQSIASANAKHCLHLGVPSPCFFNRAVIYAFALTARPSPTWNNPGYRYALPWAVFFCAYSATIINCSIFGNNLIVFLPALYLQVFLSNLAESLDECRGESCICH